ncbi:TRAP transporter small permease [Pelagibius sp. Alg239-R121]|uniref:TRAP transporter small permease n=1 Tax=Pelagibius sp. Alg239-R121 TaxID=2993448 RepID=UPI0024A79172|nr:TRAP transporter small permease [Pelagibius sp. Alg239-R121]
MGNKVLSFFDNIESYICRTLLALFVLLLFAQILSREIFGHSFSWSEELSTYMFVWFVFFGASYAAKMSAHNRVTFQLKFLSPKGVQIVEGIADLFWLAFNVYFIYLSYDFVFNKMNLFWKSQTLGVPMKYIYIILPLAFTLMTFRILQINYLKLVKGVDIRDPEKAEVEKMIKEGGQ